MRKAGEVFDPSYQHPECQRTESGSALQNQIANPFVDDCLKLIDLVDHGSLRCLVHPALPK
jgi:hypothetical protein